MRCWKWRLLTAVQVLPGADTSVLAEKSLGERVTRRDPRCSDCLVTHLVG
jgi:hypothetical protein